MHKRCYFYSILLERVFCLLFCFICFFKTGSHCVALAGLKLVSLTSQPPDYLDYKCVPLLLFYVSAGYDQIN
jgi:hypothetical protein